VDGLFAETISRSRRVLKEIEEANQCGLPHDRAEARERCLADFARHYTMQAERAVHEGVTETVVGAAPVAVLAEQSPSREAEETGENVESF